VLLHVQDAQKRVPPIRSAPRAGDAAAEFHSAEPAANRQLCL
jgi:hypothetical protein